MWDKTGNQLNYLTPQPKCWLVRSIKTSEDWKASEGNSETTTLTGKEGNEGSTDISVCLCGGLERIGKPNHIICIEHLSLPLPFCLTRSVSLTLTATWCHLVPECRYCNTISVITDCQVKVIQYIVVMLPHNLTSDPLKQFSHFCTTSYFITFCFRLFNCFIFPFEEPMWALSNNLVFVTWANCFHWWLLISKKK